MAEPASSTITLPLPGGKKVNVPKWGLIAGVGGLAAVFLFLKNKGAASTAGDATAGEAAADQAAGGADLLSYIQDLFANLQGLGSPGEDIIVTPTQPGRNPTPNASVVTTPQPTMQITPSSYVAAFQAPQYQAAEAGVSGRTSLTAVATQGGSHAATAWSAPTVTAPTRTQGPVPPPTFSPIVQQAGHGVQQ